jgi:REP element-mobilizing transposase RayT
MVGYMLTWTTYGSWLQGDERGWVKNGRVLQPDIRLYLTNKQKLKSKPVTLNESQRRLVKEAIFTEAERINHRICALAVCSNHVHIVTEPCSESIPRIVQRYKRVSTYALQKNGFNGKVWPKGYDKRYCFDVKDMGNVINYVSKQILV